MGVSYNRISLQKVSDDTRKRYMNFTHRHRVYMDLEGKIFLIGSYANDVFSYMFELQVDQWNIEIDEESRGKLDEIQCIIEEEYKNKAMYHAPSWMQLDSWRLTKHICKLGELNPDRLRLTDVKLMINNAQERMRFYTKFIDWDRVNLLLDEVDQEKPEHSGWGIHYPSKLRDELSELYDKDFILLTNDKYVHETYIRLQKHMLEEMYYYYESMK